MSLTRTEWPLRMAVERGKCLEMAHALRATQPQWFDADRLVAIPTFPAVLNHWGFSGTAILTELGCTLSRVLHGSEEFEYPAG
ncbi:MAG: MaoC family dehydratase N-terminal domain-containing protein, partial [Acetobacteraceae bacterium]|nr:MaoC family dehydratase N-terminal domain-containing protein [Acetobacteraceae bacterium]